MKNLFKKISSIMLVLVMVFSISATAFAQSPSTKKVDTNKAIYEITINNTTIQLKEGEKAQVPLTPINNSNSGIHTDAIFTGNAGTLNIWPSAGRVYYSLKMNISATSFSGFIQTTDLTSGFSGGLNPVSGFSDSVPTSNLSGHIYSASLTGKAYLNTVPVATCVPNYIVWTNYSA